VYSLAVYAGGQPLCTQILPGQGPPPATILGIRKLDTLHGLLLLLISLLLSFH